MKMNTKGILELLGFLAVAASLVFVGLQLRLDSKIALADQYFNRSESVKEDIRTLMVSPVYYKKMEEQWALGNRPSYWNEDWELAKQLENGAVTVSSLANDILDIKLSIIGYDNIYFQYKQGLIDEKVWRNFEAGLKRSLVEHPELYRAATVRHVRPTLRPLIEQWVDEIENEK